MQNIQILKEVCQLYDQVQWQRPAPIQLFYFQFLTVTHVKSEELLTRVRDNLIPRSSRLGISLVLDDRFNPQFIYTFPIHHGLQQESTFSWRTISLCESPQSILRGVDL